MTRKRDTGAAAEWARFWDQAQQQAWDTWSRAARRSSPPADLQPDRLWSLWSDGLERLWQGRGNPLSDTSQAVSSHLLEQGRGFLFLSHQLLHAVERMQGDAGSDRHWKSTLREAIDGAQDNLRQWSEDSVGQTALWGLPVEMWDRLSSALSLTPGDWVRRMKEQSENAAGTGRQESDGLLPWLALGMGREGQLRARRGFQAAERCQKAWRRYAAQLVDVGVLALDLLYQRLVAAGEGGQRIRQLRAVYDLWVDAAEQAYAQVVGTPEFAELQAEVINSAVALKLQLQESLEIAARAHNLPTRDELDGAHRAINGLREELRKLRERLDALPARPGSKRDRT